MILGAGFAGLFAAKEFEKLCRRMPDTEVTLIDRNNYHMFVPLLYHVATGGIDAGNICFAVRATLRNGGTVPPVMFRECEVQSIDLQKKTVVAGQTEFPYDYLVVGLGSTNNYYGVPGVEENATPLKTIEDATAIHNRILENFEKAMLERDDVRRRELLTFVIVGGGATGAELGSTMAMFVFKTLARDFPTLSAQARVVMVEASDSLLHGMRPELGRLTQKRLESLGVEVLLNCQVAGASRMGIQTKDGRSVPSATVIWVAGIKPGPLVEGLPVTKAKDGRIVVNWNLEVPEVPGLFAVGDCASATQKRTSTPYPPTAQSAARMGITCARNIAGSIGGGCLCPFDYRYKGDLVFLGRNYAVGEFANRIVRGLPASLMYQGYHLMTLMGFKNKLITVADWAYDYFYSRNTTRI